MKYKKVIVKFGGLILVIVLLNFIYTSTLQRTDLQQNSPLSAQIEKAGENADVLYLGESSNYSFAPADTEKKSISEFTADFFPALRFTAIDTGAVHAGIYKKWIQYLDSKSKVSTIIVTMNLRSFGAGWIHSELETALQKSVVLLENRPALVNRFFLSLKAYDNKNEEERKKEYLEKWKSEKIDFPFPFRFTTVRQWDDAIANGGIKNEKGEWDMKKIELAAHYVKSYAFTIREDNPRVKDFDAIAEYCRANNKKIVLHLLAENLEYADSLVGKELVWLMKNNRDFLVKRYQSKGVMVVDNLQNVSGKDFIDQDWTTEHYVQRGRKQVAKVLADSLKKIFPADFRTAY
jgi:hypothetical protein